MANVYNPRQAECGREVGCGDTVTAPLTQVDVLQPKPHEILAKINWTGACASGKSLLHDEWSGFGLTMQEATTVIAGHESARTVVAIGDAVSNR